MRRPAVRILVLALMVLSACTRSDLELGGDTVGGIRPEVDRSEGSGSDPDEVVDLALDDLREYWSEAFPRLYGDAFTPLRDLVPYGPRTDVPRCGTEPLEYFDIAGNALYCPDEDLIAWDRVALIPDLAQRFGPLTVGIVMAHEYAHAIQARAGVAGATVTLELQADCFAGAWAADVAERIDGFGSGDGSLDRAVGGFLELRDTVGVSAADPNAHGSGFDRVSAFQDGYEVGAAVCMDYETDPPSVVAIPFVSVDDLNQGGNLPIDQLVGPLLADLESFFAELVASQGGDWDPVDAVVPVDPATDVVTCGDQDLAGEDLELASFYCVPDDTVYLDNVGLVPALDEIGDFAFGGELARQYAFAAQARLGILDRHLDTELHADCVTGVFAAAEFFGEVPAQELVLSPGDLDEIVIAFLAFGSDADTTAFERTIAFRTGFTDGFDACEVLLVD